MSQDGDESDKEHDATPHKLAEARKQGDVPQAADLLFAMSLGGFLLALLGLGGWVVVRAGSAGMALIERAGHGLPLSGQGPPLAGLAFALAGAPLVLLCLPPILALVTAAVTRTLVFAPVRLAPKLSRVSPIATARHKFGPEGLVEFGKSTAKLILVALALCLFLAARIEEVIGTVRLDPAAVATVLVRLMVEFLVVVFLLVLVIGGIDYLWQLYRFRLRNRMSRKEVLDEHKENEGDPHLKSARRRRAEEVAMNRMLADVATADVVVVNPTHFAVALKWDRSKGRAPVCVAKGVDEIAHRIRERAMEHGVAIHSDPPTARAIHASVEIGQEIRVEHYRAVAAAIRFADAMRRKARKP